MNRARTALAAALTFAAAGCQPKQPPNRYVEPPPAPVTVQKPVRDHVSLAREWTGRTEASDTVDLRARVTGFLQEARFKEGQEVKEGDVLFIIDPLPFQAVLDQAKAAITAAEARLKFADAEAARYRELIKTSAVSQTDLDLKVASFEQATAAKLQAEAAARSAELDLGYTTISAPISGKITKSLVSNGNLVGAGEATLLATIVKSKPLYCYFNASEQELLEYQKNKREGKTKASADGNTEAGLGLADEEGAPHKGVIDYIAPELDKSTGTIQIRASFENTDDALVPGLFARVQVAAPPRDVVLVPELCIQVDQVGRFVYVANAQNVIERRDVTVGKLHGADRIIEKGLTGDESVIVSGLARARVGAKVNPTAAAPAVAAGQ